MKKFGILELFILSLFVGSCSERSYVTFPETVTVTTYLQNFDSVYMHYPYRMKLFGTTLYVMDLHPNGYYCHEFTYPSMVFVGSFAHKGKVPGELTGIGNIAVDAVGKVYVLNNFGREIYT